MFNNFIFINSERFIPFKKMASLSTSKVYWTTRIKTYIVLCAIKLVPDYFTAAKTHMVSTSHIYPSLIDWAKYCPVLSLAKLSDGWWHHIWVTCWCHHDNGDLDSGILTDLWATWWCHGVWPHLWITTDVTMRTVTLTAQHTGAAWFCSITP